MSDFSMEDAGDQFEDDLLKAMQNSLEVNKATKPAATEPSPAYKGKLHIYFEISQGIGKIFEQFSISQKA